MTKVVVALPEVARHLVAPARRELAVSPEPVPVPARLHKAIKFVRSVRAERTTTAPTATVSRFSATNTVSADT
jgi:hypothetical protein